MTKDEALKLALEALKSINEMFDYEGNGFKLEYEIKALEEALKQAFAAPVQEPATDSFVQQVPDKCDRIVWRGIYYHLPPAAQWAQSGDEI
jgi:hypothetical protein